MQILALHIIPGQALKSTDVSDGQKFKTLSGEEVTFSVMADIDVMSVTVPSGVNSEVILKNLEACSAVVHVIGTMLLPDVKKVCSQFDLFFSLSTTNVLHFVSTTVTQNLSVADI